MFAMRQGGEGAADGHLVDTHRRGRGVVTPGAAVDSVTAAAYRIPTDSVEADGTLTWDSTTLVTAEVSAAGRTGFGYTYASAACLPVIDDILAPAVTGRSALDTPGSWQAMVRAIRNIGRPGVASCAISAVDIALWDLKARILDVPLVELFGAARDVVPIYGSGGFVNYDDDVARAQLERWVRDWSIPRVKIKIGQDYGAQEHRDLRRVAFARSVIGEDVSLFVDANGGYRRKQAIRVGRALEDSAVTWFEEPVSSDDVAGLRQVRAACRADVAAGEYGFDLAYFEAMVAADAVDCLQIDVTRCGGYTEWLRVAAVAAARSLDVSAHCAPAAHLPVAAAVTNLRHVEYFHDHARIEGRYFDGAASPAAGGLAPIRDRPGHGWSPKLADLAEFRIG
jgi:L-alanine-DL-glutamate epimerase-like enolase superfamily enzyme